MKSIIQIDKECYVCGNTYGLELHHCIYGTSNRKLSDKYGLTVWLCAEHHRGRTGVHQNRDLDLALKKLAQTKFEAVYGENTSFQEVFKKNYL